MTGAEAVAKLNQTRVGSVLIRVQPSVRDPNARRQARSQANIFVSGLPDSKLVDSESLGDSFMHWGEVLSSRVTFDDSGRPTHGHVLFRTPGSARQAIEEVCACARKTWPTSLICPTGAACAHTGMPGLGMHMNIGVREYRQAVHGISLQRSLRPAKFVQHNTHSGERLLECAPKQRLMPYHKASSKLLILPSTARLFSRGCLSRHVASSCWEANSMYVCMNRVHASALIAQGVRSRHHTGCLPSLQYPVHLVCPYCLFNVHATCVHIPKGKHLHLISYC